MLEMGRRGSCFTSRKSILLLLHMTSSRSLFTVLNVTFILLMIAKLVFEYSRLNLLFFQIEYMIVKFDHVNEKAQVSLKAEEILKIMDKREREEGEKRLSLWRPEFAAYMIEGTPGSPYGCSDNHSIMLSHFNHVEENMKIRRREIESLLDKDESLFSLTSFPR